MGFLQPRTGDWIITNRWQTPAQLPNRRQLPAELPQFRNQ